MKNYINVQKYLSKKNTPDLYPAFSDILFDNYYEMVEWLETNVSRAMQGYDPIYDGVGIGRCGEGWSLNKMAISNESDKPMETSYQWCVTIDDPELAVMFKLTWP
jgi:hypothetical protein